MLLILALSTAYADTDAGIAAMDIAECTAGFASFSQPMPGTTGVPLDVAPAVVIEAEGCSTPGEWTLTLKTAADGAVVQSIALSAASGLAELIPDAPLTAETDYVLVVEPNDMSAGPTEIAFTTGLDTSVADAPIPTLSAVAAEFDPATPRLFLDATTTLGETAGRDLIVQVMDASKDPYAGSSMFTDVSAMGTSLGESWASTRTSTSAPESWCVAARARNLDGSWSESEVFCVDVEIVESSAGSCSTSGSAPVGIGFALALAALGARRRQGSGCYRYQTT